MSESLIFTIGVIVIALMSWYREAIFKYIVYTALSFESDNECVKRAITEQIRKSSSTIIDNTILVTLLILIPYFFAAYPSSFKDVLEVIVDNDIRTTGTSAIIIQGNANSFETIVMIPVGAILLTILYQRVRLKIILDSMNSLRYTQCTIEE